MAETTDTLPKFIVQPPASKGGLKDKRFLTINPRHNFEKDDPTLDDLLHFLEENGIDPKKVELPLNFTTMVTN